MKDCENTFEPLEGDAIHTNHRSEIDGKSREQRMAVIWDRFTPEERIVMMKCGGIQDKFIGKGREYDPYLSWETGCGCSQKTAITNHCLRLYEV